MAFYKVQFRIDNVIFPAEQQQTVYKPNETINHDVFAEIIEQNLATISYLEESEDDWQINKIDSASLVPATFIELHLPLENAFLSDAVIDQCVEFLRSTNLVKYHYGFGLERHISYEHIDDSDAYLIDEKDFNLN